MTQNLLSLAVALFFALSVAFYSSPDSFKTDLAFDIPTFTVPEVEPVAIPEQKSGDLPSLEEIVTNIVNGDGATSTEALNPNIQLPPLPIVIPPVNTNQPTAPIVIPTIPIPPTNTEVPPVVNDPVQTRTKEEFLKGVIVNIICMPDEGHGLRGSSGSGVIVDSRGIVATVAHVGQYFLLKDYPTDNSGYCVIRTGSPAKNAYVGELVYLPEVWIRENKTVMIESRPKGTGENDFALIAITGSATNIPLPSSFLAAPFTSSNIDIDEGDEARVGSYGAEFLTSSQIRSSLYPTIVFGTVKDIFTFEGDQTDLIEVNGGVAAQEGSSGGVVLDSNNRTMGIITTRTVRPDLSLRDLQAITPNHIRTVFEEEMDTNFDTYIRSSTPFELVQKFDAQAGDLLEVLADVLRGLR